MNPVYRLKLHPTAPWRTPWQADTLTGMLLATCARVHGTQTLRSRLIDPMLAGHPPFVLSDALPGNLLPFPIALRLASRGTDTHLKDIKKARWLTPDDFLLARAGQCPPAVALLRDDAVFSNHTRQHNTLSRTSDTSAADDENSAIGIFQRPETALKNPHGDLSVYFRILNRADADLLLDLFHELSLSGFGADTSTGRGQFDLPDDPAPMPQLDQPPPGANGVIALSTFQPAPDDSADGYWDAFPKFGKLGPDLALEDVRKNTLILLKPGACFRTSKPTPFMGRAIPVAELLPPQSTARLRDRDVEIIHPAFALTIPATFQGHHP